MTDYDPQSAAISAAFAAAFLDYYHGELKFGQGSTYHTTNFSIGDKWKWTHKTAQRRTADGQFRRRPRRGTGARTRTCRVLVLNGYYDLATPFSATEYVMTHLGVPPGWARASR